MTSPVPPSNQNGLGTPNGTGGFGPTAQGAANAIPGAQANAAAGALWSAIDLRAQTAVQDYVRQNLGIPRPRTMTCTIPLGSTPPVQGWFTSVAIFQAVRITGWVVQALTPGTMTLDICVSNTYQDPTQAPVLISVFNGL